MRLLIAMLLLPACGRLGFTSVDGQSVDAAPPARIDVVPRWAPPAGATIRVTFLDEIDATGATVTLDGAPCGAPRVTGNELACDAPPHSPGVVTLTASAGATDETSPFHYLAPGPVLAGGSLDDASSGIAVDTEGNTYVSGGTTGSLDGPNAGDFDAVLAKFDGAGTLVWIRQLGSAAYDYARDVAVDRSGEITLIGYTAGDLDGPSAGGNDVFVARFRPDGTLRWVTQLGSAGDDQSWDLAVDAAGGTVIALRTTGDLAAPNAGDFDYGIARLDPDGNVVWTRQAGTALEDMGHSIAVTPDGVAFLVGYTTGVVESGATNAGGRDLFVARYESDGTQTWIRQRGGAGDDRAQDATVDDAGDVWVAGATSGALDGEPARGSDDILVAKWSPAGAHAFTRLYGGTGSDYSFAIAVAPSGLVSVGCSTTGAFDGEPFAGGTDLCAMSLERDGTRRWTRILGTPVYDAISSVAISPAFADLALFSVITAGPLAGAANHGSNDLGFLRFDSDGNAL
jgi:hypothetical protein